MRVNQLEHPLFLKAKKLPIKPGCYLMKNKKQEILYVGKAKALKSRVSSYFSNSKKGAKTEILVSHIEDFDFILTENDAEAFVLENNLIKKHRPKYNIRLKDDKSYPYVVVNYDEPFPRLKYQRQVKRSGNKDVFGPFVVGSNISSILRIVTKAFKLRDCSLREFRSRKNPCLLFQMNQCSAPCVDNISEEEYKKDLKLAVNFFKGKGKQSLKVLNERMSINANDEKFESAAYLRDSIFSLDEFVNFSLQKNTENNFKEKDIDIISTFVGETEIDIALYMIRNGILLGHKNFNFYKNDISEDLNEEVMSYLFQYYTTTFDSYPNLIVSRFSSIAMEAMANALESVFNKNIKTLAPTKRFESLMKLTSEQAEEHQLFRIRQTESDLMGLQKLQDLLNLKEVPKVLECYDIAIWQGKSPTAGQVVFHDGRPDKKSYRFYHLEERDEGNNDFAMMKEVIGRRIKYGSLPDVFIVDGGKGQLSSFSEVLKDFDIDIPVVAIAKSKIKNSGTKAKEVEKTEERLFIPGRSNPYILKKSRSLFRIIVQMRDEAHRFSRKLHHKKEKQSLFKSWFDDIDGIGPKIKEKILRKLDVPIRELESKSVEEISLFFNISKKISKSIKDQLDKTVETTENNDD
jgi:excinuclease ABC subunit C